MRDHLTAGKIWSSGRATNMRHELKAWRTSGCSHRLPGGLGRLPEADLSWKAIQKLYLDMNYVSVLYKSQYGVVGLIVPPRLNPITSRDYIATSHTMT
jgi:hypothetical protein